MRGVRARDLQVATGGFHAHRIAIESFDQRKQARCFVEMEIGGRGARIAQQAIDHHAGAFAGHRRGLDVA